MRHILFATVAVLGLATAIPAFADSGDNPDRVASANSLPSGFYNQTLVQLHAQIKQNYFGAQQAKPVAKNGNGGGLNHVDILSYMLGQAVEKAG